MGAQVTKDETRLLIGGTWVEAGDGTYDIINPATEQVVGQAPNASAEDAANAAAAAAEAFPAWAATPAEERLSMLKAAGAAIRAQNDELVPLVIAETGATASVGSRMQVPVSAARFDRYSQDIAHVQEHMLPPVVSAATPLAPGGLISALAYRQPVGVVAAIASYNFPMTNMAGKVAPALAMGNTVIMKPAPQDPLAVISLARVLDEVGFPPGVINVINSEGPEPASVLTTAPEVDMVSFTGSTAVGQRIAAGGGLRRRRHQGSHHRHRLHLGLPLRSDLHRPHPRRRPPEHLRQGGRGPVRVRRLPQGGRPDRGRHRGGPAHLRRPTPAGARSHRDRAPAG
jgi:acyl-CoA reductase-like NAD-dependent aldehyde dehydrogenase